MEVQYGGHYTFLVALGQIVIERQPNEAVAYIRGNRTVTLTAEETAPICAFLAKNFGALEVAGVVDQKCATLWSCFPLLPEKPFVKPKLNAPCDKKAPLIQTLGPEHSGLALLQSQIQPLVL
jgi:hypothetical protein